ncbi:MAG: hypothetical protein GDA56_32090 [Hormoscilla sp. GM7CHS1pb]|nr:hypothetical protein [Hormoscilla sp. GM7CHS1pb]MBC6481712.1 hypothetical protein [Hormoscilla sp. GM7CHS1pb]
MDRRNLEMMKVQVLLPRCRGKSIAPTVASRPETPTHVVRGSDTTGWVLPDAMASIRKAGRFGVNDWQPKAGQRRASGYEEHKAKCCNVVM